jgi:hypothetical protein
MGNEKSVHDLFSLLLSATVKTNQLLMVARGDLPIRRKG